MTHPRANDDMIDGYMDGFHDDRAEFPSTLSNRGAAFRHGWENGRDDRVGKPRATARVLRVAAESAMEKDRMP